MEIRKKIVWITGASSGIGKALTEELARHHCKFILTSRNQNKLKQLVEDLQLSEEQYYIAPFDLTNYQKIPELVQKVRKKFPKIDIIIHNAGVSQRALAEETEISTTEKILFLDFFAPVSLTRSILPYLNEPGNITVISSVAGIFGSPYRSSYSAAKHALHGYFDSLRIELRKRKQNIQVLIVCPGFVKTNISVNALIGDGSLHNQMDKGIEKGLDPQLVARKILESIQKEKKEVVIAGFRELFAVYLKRFFPGILTRILEKAEVT